MDDDTTENGPPEAIEEATPEQRPMSRGTFRIITAICAIVIAVSVLAASVTYMAQTASEDGPDDFEEMMFGGFPEDFEGEFDPDDFDGHDDDTRGERDGAEDQADGNERGGHERTVASYRVNGDSLEGDADPEAARIWQRFVTLIPADQRTEIAEFALVTDGRDGSLAAVGTLDDDGKQWVLEVDPADAKDAGDLDHSLIHEFGHILTLRPPQIDFARDGKCANYRNDEGCTAQTSYLNQFVERFWDGDDTDAVVTEEAGISPEEDIAESWTAFVLENTPQDKAAAKKIAFFENYPELVDLKARIRAGL